MLELMERPMVKRRDMGYEDKLMSILTERGAHAIDMKELRSIIQLPERVFLNTFARLIEKDILFRWRSDTFRDFVVLIEYQHTAYYFETITTTGSLFEPAREIAVQRSVPFVLLLDDEEARSNKRNRYRLAD
jgi:hypothetical protein